MGGDFLGDWLKVLFALVVSWVCCVPSFAIIRGQSIEGRRDFAAFVKVDFANSSCSGTLIASHLILTARHCLISDQNRGSRLPLTVRDIFNHTLVADTLNYQTLAPPVQFTHRVGNQRMPVYQPDIMVIRLLDAPAVAQLLKYPQAVIGPTQVPPAPNGTVTTFMVGIGSASMDPRGGGYYNVASAYLRPLNQTPAPGPFNDPANSRQLFHTVNWTPAMSSSGYGSSQNGDSGGCLYRYDIRNKAILQLGVSSYTSSAVSVATSVPVRTSYYVNLAYPPVQAWLKAIWNAPSKLFHNPIPIQ